MQAAAYTLYCLVKPHWLATFTTSRTLSLYWLKLRSLLSISCKYVRTLREKTCSLHEQPQWLPLMLNRLISEECNLTLTVRSYREPCLSGAKVLPARTAAH